MRRGSSLALLIVPLFLIIASTAEARQLDPLEVAFDLKLLGKYAFFDEGLSVAPRMGCVTCHDPEAGGTFPISGVNLHQVVVTGANPHTRGNLKTPTNMYASFIQPFAPCDTGGLGGTVGGNFCGGVFWSGRSEGNAVPVYPAGATEHIGNEVFVGLPPLFNLHLTQNYAQFFGAVSDQALNPFPNAVEQNISRLAVCEHVRDAQYAPVYTNAWGEPPQCDSQEEVDISFKKIALAIGAWQHSPDLNSFSSKRDQSLREELACFSSLADTDPDYDDTWADYYDPSVCLAENRANWGEFPLVGFTAIENWGHDIFFSVDFGFTRRFPAPPVDPDEDGDGFVVSDH